MITGSSEPIKYFGGAAGFLLQITTLCGSEVLEDLSTQASLGWLRLNQGLIRLFLLF